MKLIFVDTETTGNDLAKDRLCQICYKVDGEKKCVVSFFKPPLPVSVKAMSITHITNKMLEDKPAFAGSRMMQDLQNLLNDGVMVAHNAVFDKAILEAEGMSVPKFICTLRVARFLDDKESIPEYNLPYLRYYLDLEVDGHPHDAEADVNACEALYRRLFQKIRSTCDNDEEAVSKMLEISSKPHLFNRLSFGKYKDKPIDEVAATDPDYLLWLLKQKESDPVGEEDWLYTLKHYLQK